MTPNRLRVWCSVTSTVMVMLFGCTPTGAMIFEMTGTVVDKDTRQPLEGAYVMASYQEQRAEFVAVTSYCVKTRGMYTGKDGKFSFPVERLDGRSPNHVVAIKPGYYFSPYKQVDSEVWKRQGIDAYQGRVLPLAKQDESKPLFRLVSADAYCHRARTREDAAAGIAYLKIELAEYKRLGRGAQQEGAVERMIRRLQNLPSQASEKN